MPVGFSRGGTGTDRSSPYERKAKTAIFLTSTHTSGHDAKLAAKLEENGCKLGSGLSQKLAEEGFQEGTPLMKCLDRMTGIKMALVTDDDLNLYRDKANSEWLKPWENFSAATKLGVLVLAGSAQGFQAWASKPEAKLEMQYTPKGRLYVYLADGGSSDGADVGGVIVALTEEGCATVENGKGTILYADGSMYSGDIADGERHGVGRTTLLGGATSGGAVTTAEYENGKMVKLIGEGTILTERRGTSTDGAGLWEIADQIDGKSPARTQPRGPKSPTMTPGSSSNGSPEPVYGAN